jgi:cytochrome oxidase Cu insertion factor (SCO1/SenC/PrrC family)
MARADARLAVIALLAAALTAGGVQAAPGQAPAFSLELFNGKTLRLADLRGRPVILLFWTQW